MARVSGQAAFSFCQNARGEQPSGKASSAKGPLSRQRMEWTLQKVEQKSKEIEVLGDIL